MGFAGWDEFWGFVRGRVEVSVAALVERLLVLGLLVPPFYLHYRDPVLRCILNLQCVIAGWLLGHTLWFTKSTSQRPIALPWLDAFIH